MGGLRRLMPITFATFLIGALAQAGIPPLAGFFAKDAVLEVAQHTGRELAYVLGSVAAFLSAFYLGRMLFLTFFGEGRSDRARQAHESPPLLWVPLAILAFGVATAGWLNLTPEGRLTGFLEQVTGAAPVGNGLEVAALAATATVISIVALALTWWIYGTAGRTMLRSCHPLRYQLSHGKRPTTAPPAVITFPASKTRRVNRSRRTCLHGSFANSTRGSPAPQSTSA